jgi:hypothetical protein
MSDDEPDRGEGMLGWLMLGNALFWGWLLFC